MLEDPVFWILVAPGLLLGFWAQSLIKSNYVQYSQIPISSRLTGAQVARRMLDSQGLHSVGIVQTPGMLSDHYDPRKKLLRLSPEVFGTSSVSAAGIAAHEAGHALQDADGYFPMQVRSWIVPLVHLSSRFAPWFFFGGTFLGWPEVAWIGVILFGSSTLFTLVTLPVELDASARARELLDSQRLVEGSEQVTGIARVLKSAAWTYVAGAVSAVGSILYIAFVVLFRFRRP